MALILVVDDDQSIITAFRHFLGDEGHDVRTAGTVADALTAIEEERPDLVFMDVRMPGMSGLEGLEEMRRRYADLPVVVMTAYGTSQTSIDAIRAGAFDYLGKPLDLADLRNVMAKAIVVRRSPDDEGEPEWSATDHPVHLVGNSPRMLQLYKLIGRLATNDVPALITGERGTGKQLIAETIHSNSSRKDRAFAALDCASLSDAVAEEIFSDQAGTILLANVEGLTLPLQARLVRAMNQQQGRVAATGLRLAARILASTERDLGESVRQDTFNRALYDAISAITIRVPPLRERREDIPVLVRHLILRLNTELHRTIRGIDGDVAKTLQEHQWPGNVLELETVLKRACVLARGEVVTASDLEGGFRMTPGPQQGHAESALQAAATAALHERLEARASGPGGSPFHDVVDLVEAALVEEALAITKGNQVKASEILGVNRATLRKKMPDQS
jgi:DNA-binding NtrC family response regulator